MRTFTRYIIASTTYRDRYGNETVLDGEYQDRAVEGFTVQVYPAHTVIGKVLWNHILWMSDHGYIDKVDFLDDGATWQLWKGDRRLRVGITSDTTAHLYWPDGPYAQSYKLEHSNRDTRTRLMSDLSHHVHEGFNALQVHTWGTK